MTLRRDIKWRSMVMRAFGADWGKMAGALSVRGRPLERRQWQVPAASALGRCDMRVSAGEMESDTQSERGSVDYDKGV